MKTVEVIVEHAGKNLSAYIEGAPVRRKNCHPFICYNIPIQTKRVCVKSIVTKLSSFRKEEYP